MRRLIGTFLGTFANQVATFTPGRMSPNNTPILMEYELDSALTSGQTLTLTLPQVDKNYVPVAMACWTAATPALAVWQPNTANSLVMTSYNRDTGVLVATAGSAGVADNSVVSVLFIPATEGS